MTAKAVVTQPERVKRSGIMGESETVFQHCSDPIQRPVRRSPVPVPDSTTRLIPLTQGQFAVVDAADFEFLNQWKWFAHWNSKTKSFYAVRSGARVNGRQAAILMHRAILGCVLHDGSEVDHRDHDTLNNRRSNLRLAGKQNQHNQNIRKDNTSGFKGGDFPQAVW